jgi:integrase
LFGINALKRSSLGKLRLDEIGTERIAAFTSELQQREKARGKAKITLQLSTINSCLRALRRVLRLAAEWSVIEVVPRIKMLSGERHRERVLTATEEAKYLSAGSALLHDVSLVLFDTGMRPEECHRMQWEYINWAGGRYGTILIQTGKTKAARRVLPLSHRVRLMLEKRCKDADKPAEGWVWPANNKDGRINHDSLKTQHKTALKLSKVRAFEVYSIRHTFLTRLGESGCDVWTLARIAGHSNIKMSQRYVHPSEDSVLKAFSRLDGNKVGHREEMALKNEEPKILENPGIS